MNMKWLSKFLPVPKLPGVRMVIVDFGTTAQSSGADLVALPAIAAAITRQCQEHLALAPPFGHGISATIRVTKTVTDIQPDEWVIGLFAHADQPGALGYHDKTPSGKPVLKVFPLLDKQDGAELSVTISHEVLEALADSEGAKAAQWLDGKFWAYEIGDAVENDSYLIDGVLVSNFVLPPYFEPIQSRAGIKYDYLGLCRKPLEIRPGGYGQWYDPARGWQQVVHAEKSPRPYRQKVQGRSFMRRNRLQVRGER